eukprot:Lankesteria_metandrocarpae@DN5712_c0_g1_i1.p1
MADLQNVLSGQPQERIDGESSAQANLTAFCLTAGRSATLEIDDQGAIVNSKNDTQSHVVPDGIEALPVGGEEILKEEGIAEQSQPVAAVHDVSNTNSSSSSPREGDSDFESDSFNQQPPTKGTDTGIDGVTLFAAPNNADHPTRATAGQPAP